MLVPPVISLLPQSAGFTCAYVTCALMGRVAFISGRGVKPWILTSVIGPAGTAALNVMTLVYVCVCAYESIHAHIIMQMAPV